MGWRDLLPINGERLIAPWVGGRELQQGMRIWKLEGRSPPQYGWHEFELKGRTAQWIAAGNKPDAPFSKNIRGYLVGNRFVAEDAQIDPSPAKIFVASEEVFLIEDGLDRFVPVIVGRAFENGPLIFDRVEMPFGPESEVLTAFLDRLPSVNHIKGVIPALDAAFQMECFQRSEADRRRAELEKKRQEEEAKRTLEERRQKLVEQLGDSVGRRAMAAIDFGEAAKAALAIGNAEYLDHKRAANRGEMVVIFRLNRRRFECTCDERTLQIIDSGICLTDHDTGEKGDTWLTLESLPSVIKEAIDSGLLHVYRHVD